MLHVVYRVGDMQKHIDYYKDMFGMQLLRYRWGGARSAGGGVRRSCSRRAAPCPPQGQAVSQKVQRAARGADRR
jgi:catechol 2,3-dioxygenase-like lactoylglutathione lyase family enzyme